MFKLEKSAALFAALDQKRFNEAEREEVRTGCTGDARALALAPSSSTLIDPSTLPQVLKGFWQMDEVKAPFEAKAKQLEAEWNKNAAAGGGAAQSPAAGAAEGGKQKKQKVAKDENAPKRNANACE
jgi:hypothetical protein